MKWALRPGHSAEAQEGLRRRSGSAEPTQRGSQARGTKDLVGGDRSHAGPTAGYLLGEWSGRMPT